MGERSTRIARSRLFLYWKGHIVADKTSTPAYVAVREAAAHLSVSEVTIRRAIKAGQLPCVRIGRLVRISASDLETFAAARRTTRGA
ncbi:helix-turn-helix domain-containing protein [Amycolatopsis roodepoortensis]|uniref:helix-turn-helix domain-containing protein n=1 Tax=Amycolatopsis roodepoortensis TaxID=700274 RepID=UPI00178B2DF6